MPTVSEFPVVTGMVGSGVVRVGCGVSMILTGTGAGVSKTDVVVGCEHTVGAVGA